MKTIKRNSQYFLYAALILLPLILSVVLFFQMRFVINREIERRATQTSTQFYLQTSSMIRELHSFSSNLTNDAQVMRIFNSENEPDSLRMEFCDYLSSKVTETRNISLVYLISEKKGEIFSNEGIYTYSSLSTLLKKSGLISQDYDFDRYGIDWALYNESGYAPFCVTPVANNSGENIGYIIAALDYRRFMDYFRTLDATVCAVYSDNFYISSAIDMSERNNIDWNNQDQVNELAKEPVVCVYRHDSDYSYMVGIATREYYRPVNILLIGFGIYFFVVLIAGLVILWRLLSRKKEDTQQHIQERNLRYILYGHNNHIITEQFLKDAGLPEDTQRPFVVACFFSETNGRRVVHDIESTVLDKMQSTDLSCTYFEDLNGPVFVFWSDGDAELLHKLTIHFCHEMAQTIMDIHSVSVQICTSGVVNGTDELSDAFHQASDMHELAKKRNNIKPVFSVRDITREQHEQSDSFIRSQQILLNTLLTGKYDQIPEKVKQIQADFIDPVSENVELARLRRRTVANLLTCTLLESNLSEDDRERIPNAFRNTHDSNALNKVTEEYFAQAAAKNTCDARDTSVYEQAITYIRENLHDHNLSVSGICDGLGISVQKLTRIFHANNVHDMAIAEYVNQLRVQEAQELLKGRKNLSVAEIADTVGYNNSHSLTRNFRKFTGLTPTEYRELES